MRFLFRCCALSFVVVTTTISQPGYSDSLKPYVSFLQTQRVPARDYIISLFQNHDLVILCERLHTEITQYSLFANIVEDKRFIDSVGNIFIEIGSASQTADIAHLLQADNLSTDSVEESIFHYQRNCSFWPLWSNSNISLFIRRLYRLNQTLSGDKKVNLYPSDIPFDWNHIDTTWLKTFWGRTAALRDSIMAHQIITTFDRISQKPTVRKKALVIMNYRHAFGRRWEYPEGTKPANVGRFLFERYGSRVANVYISELASTQSGDLALIQRGKWDAAFEVLSIDNVGFDLEFSPFGNDNFDLWPYKNHFKYKDVFNGLVFYLPLKKHRIAYGVPGLIDSTFAVEVMRRYRMYKAVPKLKQGYEPTDWRSLQRDFGGEQEFPVSGVDSLLMQMQKWLRY